jgi:Glycosyl transferase family 2
MASQKSKIKNTPRTPGRRSFWTLGFSLSVLPFLARSERVYRRLPQLPVQACSAGAELPPLSIIVPARNEAHNLRRLLPSLLNQDYAGAMEIIVVDDHSTDETVDVVQCAMGAARSRPGRRLRLIAAPDLPAGWLGKPHASHLGACAAQGEWLLFTDADTEHGALSAASAVTYAAAHNLDGLSVFPRQETEGLVDRAVLVVAFAGLFAALRRSTTMLNGQYVLMRRAVYEESGGFAAVRAEMMDDLAFGKMLAQQGYKTPMMRGESVASVHMYDDWYQAWRGLTRLGSGSLRYQGLAALAPAIFITGVMMPLWTLIFNRRYIREIPSLRWIWLTAVAGFVPWARRFDSRQPAVQERRLSAVQPALTALAAPAAAVFVQAAAVWGLLSRFLGSGVSWKDRKV